VAGIRFTKLVNEFVRNLELSSATVIRERERDTVRPARFRVISSAATTDCILFLWTTTPGGGGADVRPANERRIQVTKARRFPLEPGRRTLLGGWSEEYGVYVFWDPRRHTRFSKRSPSFQVKSETLETARSVGIASYLRPARTGQEVVVAVAPSSLLWYVESGQPLHSSEGDSTGVELFAESRPDIPDEERTFIDESQNESQVWRRNELVVCMRAYRDSRFKPAVLQTYQYKCAVCQCALKLVDAAHIVPVSHPQSTDEVTNGLALCRLHHGAYDNGLLGVTSSYRVITNPDSENRLGELRLDMGLEQFKARLPKQIVVPRSIEARPDPGKLVLGLGARNWPIALRA
jgi:putative restriction endonuclease